MNNLALKISFTFLISCLVLLSFEDSTQASNPSGEIVEQLKELGFNDDEIYNLHKFKNENTEFVFYNTDMNKLNVTNKDVLHLAKRGLNKSNIISLSTEEFKRLYSENEPELKSIAVKYLKINPLTEELEQISKTEYEEIKKNKNKSLEAEREFSTMDFCIPGSSVDCSNTNKNSAVKLMVAVSNFNNTNFLVSNMEWINRPSDRFTDVFAQSHGEQIVINWNSVFGAYNTAYYNNWDEYVISAQTNFSDPDTSNSNGYAHIFDLHDEAKQDPTTGEWGLATVENGYTQAEFVWSTGEYVSVFANYAHLNKRWQTSYAVALPLGGGISITGTTDYQTMSPAALSVKRN
ncbi:hypothetical protein [Sutcliffiella horikoshii]|uniref:hypothetical protein n=1 Tax=Sutcliffiella horikoshii TaxID=79883 RepID=UPI00384C1328